MNDNPQDASPEEPTCLERGDRRGCEGPVSYRMPLSGSGESFPRCAKHWHARLASQERLRERHPETVPADFDPSYAGERWNEDD